MGRLMADGGVGHLRYPAVKWRGWSWRSRCFWLSAFNVLFLDERRYYNINGYIFKCEIKNKVFGIKGFFMQKTQKHTANFCYDISNLN